MTFRPHRYWRRYKHSKTDNIYVVLDEEARIEAEGMDGKEQVIYFCEETGRTWIRPKEGFFSEVVINGVRVPRFIPLD